MHINLNIFYKQIHEYFKNNLVYIVHIIFVDIIESL